MIKRYICGECEQHFDIKKDCIAHEKCCKVARSIDHNLRRLIYDCKDNVININQVKFYIRWFKLMSGITEELYNTMKKNKRDFIIILSKEK